MTEPFEARIRRLEDIEAIRRLKVQYFDACDGGFGGIASHEPEAIAATFAEDGTWDGGPYGARTGRSDIAAFYEGIEQGLAYTMLSEPVIDVDGDRATGRWNILVYSTSARHGSLLVGGVHHDDYVRTPAGWKIARTRFVRAMAAPAPTPWNPPAEGAEESGVSP